MSATPQVSPSHGAQPPPAASQREPRLAPAAAGVMWLGVLLLLVPLSVMYYDTLARLAGEWWHDPDNSHGLLIPPLALYFAWRRRERLRTAALAPRFWPGLLAVLGAIAIYLVGRLGAEFFLTRLSLIPLLAGLILYFYGSPHLRLLAFPLGLLVLAFPLPALLLNTISLPLQSVASQSSAGLLQVCSIPVLREGNMIHLASVSLGIAEACSGLRSLISLIALAVVIAWLRWRGWWQRVLLLALAVPLALLLNVLRITGTGLIANYWNVKYAMGFFHSFSGWIVFVVAFSLLFGASAIIQRWLPSPPPAD